MSDPQDPAEAGARGPKPERGFTLGAPDEPEALPAIDFSTFVLSLGASAMQHLGLAPDPVTGGPPEEKSLPLARQTIETLSMLEQKTRGNLDEHEAKLLQSLLYELRMAFVRADRP